MKRVRRGEYTRHLGGTVHVPWRSVIGNRLIPLNEAGLFTEMDLLALSNEADDHCPRFARPEPNKVLRFGRTVTTLFADAIRIPCTLSFVIDPDVFGGCSLL